MALRVLTVLTVLTAMAASKKPKKAAKKAAKKRPGAAAKSVAATNAPKRVSRAKNASTNPALVATTYAKLRERHADAHCELDHQNAFQLILATVLSAQSTDVMVNKITPELFKRWPTRKPSPTPIRHRSSRL